MARGVLALNVNGVLTMCTAAPEDRGKGRCNHIAHQNEGETAEEFVQRINEKGESFQKENPSENLTQEQALVLGNQQSVTQQEIDSLASKLDEIAGQRVTSENIRDVLKQLTPQQVAEIALVGFDAAPTFSLPISAERYEDENVKNKLYFANLPDYGVAGSVSAIKQMFDKVGPTPTASGVKDIEHSYMEGLTPDEYFDKQFQARDSSIAKSVGTSKPGYIARKLFYALSDIQAFADCGGPYIDALHCKLPNGHVCVHCAHKTVGGDDIKEGDLCAGIVSTNSSEGLTQLSMSRKHVGTLDNIEQGDHASIIMATVDGFGTSPIIQEVVKQKDQESMRMTMYTMLKEEFARAKLKIDDFNLMIIVKKMTSYKREKGVGLRPVEPGEKPDIVSAGAMGNSNNIFKTAELSSGYKHLTQPQKQKIEKDASNQILN